MNHLNVGHGGHGYTSGYSSGGYSSGGYSGGTYRHFNLLNLYTIHWLAI